MMPTLFEVKKAQKQGCPNCRSLKFYIRDEKIGGGFRCYTCGYLWGEKNNIEKDIKSEARSI